VGTIAGLPEGLITYGQWCGYVSSLDGFLKEDVLYEPLYSQLYIALGDYNVPIADAQEIESLAAVFCHAKKLMDGIVAIDMHCDFPEQLYYNPESGYSITESRSRCQVSVERMVQGHQSAQYLATWMDVSGSQTSASALKSAPAKLWNFYSNIDSHLKAHSDVCGVARNRDEIIALKKQGKVAFLYGLENGFWTGTDLDNLDSLVKRGYTYVTLSHNGDNQICHSALSSNNSKLGLTDFGVEYVKRMNELGLVIDLSHTSRQTAVDVMKISSAPVVFTHSGAAALFDHSRNVDDELLLRLKENGGVICVYIVPDFMASDNLSRVGLKELVEHIRHCVKVAGIDHVGVGIDLDGGGGGLGFNYANDAINLTVALINAGFTDEDITKIWGENYLRVLDKVQSSAKQYVCQ